MSLTSYHTVCAYLPAFTVSLFALQWREIMSTRRARMLLAWCLKNLAEFEGERVSKNFPSK